MKTSTRSGVDLNHRRQANGTSQSAESLESIRPMIGLLHDDARQDGESGPVDVRNAALPSRDGLPRRVEQFSQGYCGQVNCLPHELDCLANPRSRSSRLGACLPSMSALRARKSWVKASRYAAGLPASSALRCRWRRPYWNAYPLSVSGLSRQPSQNRSIRSEADAISSASLIAT